MGINFVTGVPDSLLSPIIRHFCNDLTNTQHVIAANEGAAIGLAIGNFVGTGNVPLVYLQNSGLGNAINPIVSLAVPEIMATPIILLIGWRGEIFDNGEQRKDEPQHFLQGQITIPLLETMQIPNVTVDGASAFLLALEKMKKEALSRRGPTALLIRKEAFANLEIKNAISSSVAIRNSQCTLSRESALRTLISHIGSSSPIVSTTGMLSRELYESREKSEHGSDLLIVGGMGHAISISAGLAIAKPDKKIFCLDGDGAVLMHMGALVTSALQDNIIHVIFNNGSHDSVGGHPLASEKANYCEVAIACGYDKAIKCEDKAGILAAVDTARKSKGSTLIEIFCKKGNRPNLSRPKESPSQNKENFMNYLGTRNEIVEK